MSRERGGGEFKKESAGLKRKQVNDERERATLDKL